MDPKHAPHHNPNPCANLRTKLWHMNKEAGLNYLKETIPSEPYWCVKTMRPTGPDGSVALPDTCDNGRRCYKKRADSVA